MIEIVPCRLAHLRELAHTMRDEERSEIAALGGTPRHLLIGLYRQTLEPWAAVMAEGVVAAWGDGATVLSHEALLWFVSSPLIERVPVTFAHEVKRWIGHYLVSRETIRSSVGINCARALRFYCMMGFEIGEHPKVREGFLEIRLSR